MKNFIKKIFIFFAIVSCFYIGQILAEDTNNIGTIAGQVVKSFEYIGKLMIATAYLAGIGFSIAAIFKFKQHRDNPTQVPVGTPISLLVIGIVLIFLPGIIKPAGSTIFGGDANTAAGGFTGGGVTNIPGGTSK